MGAPRRQLWAAIEPPRGYTCYARRIPSLSASSLVPYPWIPYLGSNDWDLPHDGSLDAVLVGLQEG